MGRIGTLEHYLELGKEREASIRLAKTITVDQFIGTNSQYRGKWSLPRRKANGTKYTQPVDYGYRIGSAPWLVMMNGEHLALCGFEELVRTEA